MLNCCYNVSVNLLLKFNCTKSSCFAIGKGHAFNICNIQLGNDSISRSRSCKYVGVSFIAGKNFGSILMFKKKIVVSLSLYSR